MDKKLLKEFVKIQARYEEIEALYEEIEALRDDIRARIVEQMHKEGIEKEETDLGTFTRAVRTNWEYTEGVKKLQDKVRMAQVREQKTGKATRSETAYLRYTPVTVEE